ncbi:MAG: ABC transporter ATP-binding protein [Alphaproteobacteria bacterium]|nr:ABC transporter ATP-binding protein [Alphaproteobacteria bacterium]
MTQPLLTVRDLRVEFPARDREPIAAVGGVGFSVEAGEIVGIVGESGSGKTMTVRALLRLLPKNAEVSGDIRFNGADVLAMRPGEVRGLRGGAMAMVFQDPMTSLNPVLRVGDQIGEAIEVHHKTRRGTLRQRVEALFTRVGITRGRERARAYPHEFSGGMRQRAVTAMAVANDPALLIADEPTTALDVTVQDQIIDLLLDLNQRSNTAILLITHNIALVASLCRRVLVMYAGRIVEDGPVEAVLRAPQHPYTWSLLQSVPRLDREVERLAAIPGQPPDPSMPPAGCRFQPRCRFAVPRCAEAEPPLDEVEPGHHARCWVLMSNLAVAAQ